MRLSTWCGSALAIALATAAIASPVVAAGPGCDTPALLKRLEPELERSAARIAEGKALTIVAFGSSSTQGVGASTPSQNYPNRLQVELADRFKGVEFRVVNRGKGGEDVGEEVARLSTDVLAEHPELVIWQLGTNALLRRDDLAADGELMQRGISALKAAGTDVVLMDMQYAPRVLARPRYEVMEQLIADAAEEGRVALFRRFAIMRHWQAQPDTPKLVVDDGLHMNDAGYSCLAATLADALAANWSSQLKASQARIAGGAKQPASIATVTRPSQR